ncbi:hypothetical protein DF947_10875 [Pedobacter paludis]|uniref:Uncharacterized protein n=1 Tax=Pedobacter paludis TaxID=2203212 RepID=A0A317F1X4_9SPHI|nr:hypothetical protein DF947_10875 [Pedobacter paludis]
MPGQTKERFEGLHEISYSTHIFITNNISIFVLLKYNFTNSKITTQQMGYPFTVDNSENYKFRYKTKSDDYDKIIHL